MSLDTLGWALRLTDVSPVAKLVAAFVLDGKQDHSSQEFYLDDIAEYACCSIDEVASALAELQLKHDFVSRPVSDGIVFVDRVFEPRVRLPRVPPRDVGSRFIYVVSAHGRVKIGITENPKARFQAIQTGFPDLIVNHLLIEGPAREIRRAEAAVLSSLVEFNTSGEWFAISPQLAIEAVHTALRDQGIGPPDGDDAYTQPNSFLLRLRPVLTKASRDPEMTTLLGARFAA